MSTKLIFKDLFKNKTVLITGANSGLGKNMAENYAKSGARVINLSRDTKKMESLNSKLNEYNNLDNLYYPIDVSNYKQVQIIKNDLVNKNIYPDIIINNAAGNFLCPLVNISENGWDRVIDIVLKGSFNVTHLFGNELIKKKKECVFLNISTTYTNTGSALVIPSAVAKSGVDTMMKSLTVEWSKYNMRFVGIAPGPIKDSGGVSKLDPLGIFSILNDYTNPRHRMCDPNEISELAMFLTSKHGDYINGEIVRIDGGELNKNSGEFNFMTNIPYFDKLIKK